MADPREMAKQFLEKRTPGPIRGDVQPINSFRSLFSIKELTLEEKKQLATLMHAHVFTDKSEYFERDLEQLTQLTAELKSIQKQAVVLIGERIAKAREILKSYGDQRTFTAWIDATFQSRKTAYNALSFYDLYHSLSNDFLRDQLKKMPMKASYILASRQGPHKLKEELIKTYEGEKQAEIIERIQSKLPVPLDDQRSKGDNKERLLSEIARKLSSLEDAKNELISEHAVQIEDLIDRLTRLLTRFR
jgi:predicted transcriptional regulator